MMPLPSMGFEGNVKGGLLRRRMCSHCNLLLNKKKKLNPTEVSPHVQ